MLEIFDYRGQKVRTESKDDAVWFVAADVCRVLDPLYPQYQFARHKGYGTKLHYAMLDRYGPCPEHRMSFLTKWKERRT